MHGDLATLGIKTKESNGLLLEKYTYEVGGMIEPFPAHVHPEYQFALSLDTHGCYFYRGSNLRFPKAALCILHSGESHTTGERKQVTPGTTYFVLYVDTAKMQEIVMDVSARHLTELPYFSQVVLHEPLLLNLYLQLFQNSFTTPLEEETVQLAFFTRLLNFHAQNFPAMVNTRRDNRVVKKAREYLDSFYYQNVSLDELAAVAGLSKYHLLRSFRKEIGVTPHNYQIQLRISHAKKLLLNGLNSADVAEKLGFYDQSHFGRHFKLSVGVTPQAFLH